MSAVLSVAAVESLRSRLWAAGFRPVALKTGNKMPLIRCWPERARRNPPADAVDRPCADRLNTGVLADGLRIIDLDVDDAAVVARLRALVESLFGTTIIRSRPNSPRCALIYRASVGEPRKRVIVGSIGKVEILGRGQQLHAFGRHPSGADLLWHPLAPGEATRDSLPAVTEAEVDAFLAEVAPLIGAELACPPAPRAPSAAWGNHPRAASISRRYAIGALRRAVERVATARDGQRNDTLNAECFNIGRFIHAGLLGSAEVADALAVAAAHAGLSQRETAATLASALRAGRPA